jgi:hypothetical protein
MQNIRVYVKLAICVVLTTLVLVVSAAVRTQSRESPPLTNQKLKGIPEKIKKPLALYTAVEPADPKERELRRARNSIYDKRSTKTFEELRADTTERGLVSHFWVNMPTLPTAQSDAVVLGTVVEAKGFLSNDKTGSYSEFKVEIEGILKDDDARSLMGKSSVLTERAGATVQLPSGREIVDTIDDQGTPRIGGRYVLFLKYNDQGEIYHILTGYELDDRQVTPLDPVGRFAAYKDADEYGFLQAVRAAVIRPPEAPQDQKRPQHQ